MTDFTYHQAHPLRSAGFNLKENSFDEPTDPSTDDPPLLDPTFLADCENPYHQMLKRICILESHFGSAQQPCYNNYIKNDFPPEDFFMVMSFQGRFFRILGNAEHSRANDILAYFNSGPGALDESVNFPTEIANTQANLWETSRRTDEDYDIAWDKRIAITIESLFSEERLIALCRNLKDLVSGKRTIEEILNEERQAQALSSLVRRYKDSGNLPSDDIQINFPPK